MRKITHNYCDPLDTIWLHAASKMGMRVVRDDQVFASWDGAGTLTVGTPETLAVSYTHLTLPTKA